jgi:signal-transduction protein with cAMP-binding, CBS, and nucleotidyltransferase domain
MELDDKYRVQRLITRPVVYVHPNDTLRRAALAFAEESIGAALVRGPHGAIGLISERDIVQALADDADPDRTTVADVMSQDLVTISPTDGLIDAVHRMLDAEVRHLPVMEDGVTAGMISARDAMRVLSDASVIAVQADVSSS